MPAGALLPVLDGPAGVGREHAVAIDDPDRTYRAMAIDRRRRDRRTDTRSGAWGGARSKVVSWHDPPHHRHGPRDGGHRLHPRDGRRDPAAAADRPLWSSTWSPRIPAGWSSPAGRTSRSTTRSASSTADWSAPCSTPWQVARCTARFRRAGLHLHRDQGELPQGGTPRERRAHRDGTVVKSGSRVGFTEGVVTDADGAVLATATSTLLVFDL